MAGSDKSILEQATKLANIILGGAAAICLLVLFYFIYHYSLTGERQFTSPVGVIVYYVFPALLAGLFLTSLRMRPSHKINLSLVVMGCAVSLYALELFVPPLDMTYEAVRARERQKLAEQFGRPFDGRTGREVIKDLRKEGIDAYPAVIPEFLFEEQADGRLKSVVAIDGVEVLPLAGISSKVTVFCNENGDRVIYEAGEQGFHNPKGIWNSGRIDIAAVGDSFTQGACVPSDKHFVALIRKRYPATLNLGVAATGPLIQLAIIKEYAKHAKPKIVLWFYYENDLEDLMREKRSPLLMRYLERDFDQGLFSRQAAIDSALATHVEKVMEAKEALEEKTSNPTAILKLTNLRQRLELIYGTSQHDLDGPVEIAERPDRSRMKEPDIDLFRDVLLQAKKIVSAWGGKIHFVYLPEWQRYATPESADKNRDRVLLLVKEIGLPIIDIHKAFLAHGDSLALFPFRQLVHYNEEGNRLVAEEVLRSISPVE